MVLTKEIMSASFNGLPYSLRMIRGGERLLQSHFGISYFGEHRFDNSEPCPDVLLSLFENAPSDHFKNVDNVLKVEIPGSHLRERLVDYLNPYSRASKVLTPYGPGTIQSSSNLPRVVIALNSGGILSTTAQEVSFHEDLPPMTNNLVGVWTIGKHSSHWLYRGSAMYDTTRDLFLLDKIIEHDCNSPPFLIYVGCPSAALFVQMTVNGRICYDCISPPKLRRTVQPRAYHEIDKVNSSRYVLREPFARQRLWFGDDRCGILRVVDTDEDGRFCLPAIYDRKVFLHHEATSHCIVIPSHATPMEWEDLTGPIRPGYDIIMPAVWKSDKLTNVLLSPTERGDKLCGLLNKIAGGLHEIDKMKNKAVYDVCANVIGCTEMISVSTSMMTAVTDQDVSPIDLVHSYLPAYVNHQHHALISSLPTCPAGHTLTSSVDPRKLRVVCDGCSAIGLQEHSRYFSCEECGFNLCVFCFAGTSTKTLCPLHRSHLSAQVSDQEFGQLESTSALESELSELQVDVPDLRSAVQLVPAPATEHQKMTVRAYTGDQVYRRINGDLRARGVQRIPLEGVETICTFLSKAIQCLPAQRDVSCRTLYRGLSCCGNAAAIADSYSPGDVVTWHAFTSTSTNPRVAFEWADGGIVFSVLNISAMVAAEIVQLSVYPNEEEVLIDKGARFEVVSKNGQNPIEISLVYIEESCTPPGCPVTTGTNQCMLCVFEAYIGNPNTLNESAALALIRQPEFAQIVLTAPLQFRSRMAYHYHEDGTIAPVPNVDHRRPWLYLACRYGMTELTRELLQRGADPMDRINLGSTSLHVAAFYSHIDCVREILSFMEDNPCERRVLIETRNAIDNGFTASEETSEEDIRLLIDSYRLR